jgi:methyl-accepting chemotaxis protein
MATSSEELAGQAQQLLEMISFFKLETESTVKKSFGSDKNKVTHLTNTAHQDKNVRIQHEQTTKTQKGVKINMGRDNLDSDYEKF